MGGTVALALRWAARGFRVFPVKRRSKKPLVERFYEVATSDPAQIREMWGEEYYNIGVATDDLVVVDVDTKKGKAGFDSLLALDLPLDTLTVRTPSGGMHLYFTGPSTANSAERLGPGIDTRGYHGYVLAPGSSLEIGDYVVELDVPVQPLPAGVAERLSAPRTRERNLADVSPDDVVAIAAAEATLDADMGAVEGQHGNEHTFKLAARLRDLGVAELTAFELMADKWNAKCSPPWILEELEQIVGNAYEYATSSSAIAHPSHEFAGVNIPEVVSSIVDGRRWIRHGQAWQHEGRWLFYDMLPACGVALLTGPPGGGKTFLAAHLAEKLACGDPFFGVNPDDMGATIILAAEGQNSLGPRLAVLGKGRTEPLAISATPVGALVDRSSWEALRRDLHEECDRIEDRFGIPVRLLVLDTLSASGLLVDENNNAECAKAMKKLEALAVEFNVLVLVLHHPPKNGGGLRGGSALLGSADYLVEIEMQENRHVRKLWLTKARDAQAPRPLGGFGLAKVALGVDARGRELTTCYVEASEHSVYVSRQPPHFDIFIDCFAWARADEHVKDTDPVSLAALERAFRDRDPGISKTATAKAFRECHSYAVNQGFAEMVETASIDDPYIKERAVYVPPDA